MRLIQLILISGLALSLALYLRHFRSLIRDRILALGMFLVAVLLIIFPDVSTRIANYLGVGRGVDLVIYLLGVFFTFVIIRLYSRLRDLEDRQTALVRELALLTARKPNGDQFSNPMK